jgi:phospholipase C
MRRVFATVLAGLFLNPGMLGAAPPPSAKSPKTATPIKHLVIIFQESVSFDHYFGTYPVALNGPGEPKFHAAAGTPTVNGGRAIKGGECWATTVYSGRIPTSST